MSSTIQQILNKHHAEMQEEFDSVMASHLCQTQTKLIHLLAKQYDFDPDEAIDRFVTAVPVQSINCDDKAAKKLKKAQKAAKKAQKDPNAPKKTTTAYFYFMKDKRSIVVEQHPELITTEITKKLGSMWQLIKDTDESLPYHTSNSNDKKRYLSELAIYNSSPSSTLSD